MKPIGILIDVQILNRNSLLNSETIQNINAIIDVSLPHY